VLTNAACGSPSDYWHRHPESPHLGGTIDEIRAKADFGARMSVTVVEMKNDWRVVHPFELE
jgi:hypothetical protein